MKIVIEKLTNIEHLQEACNFTSGKISNVSLKKMYACEHSPIRTQLFLIKMYDIHTFVSVHLVRHNINITHFVKSNRSDITGIEDKDITRLDPVNHLMLMNAQSLINVARKRLCRKSHEETRKVMILIKEEILKVDPDLYEFLVPECVYRGKCYELKPCKK